MVDPRPSPLDDPDVAARAWAHYRRMLRWTADVALAVIGVVWVWLYHEFGLVSIHLYIATALGFGLMIMATGALMGLMFVSHNSGHDDAIDDPLDDETWR
jgi:fatty acid desaturase